MRRTIYLLIALCGYLVAGMTAFAEASVIAGVIAAIASVPLLVWLIATGVTTGILDANDTAEPNPPKF